MYYEATQFQDVLELMASCDKLGLMYIVQKDIRTTSKMFGRKDTHTVWSLQVVKYVDSDEESDSIENDGQSTSETEPDNIV